MSADRNTGRRWRGGKGAATGSVADRVLGRPDRYTFTNDEPYVCDHPYCSHEIEADELIYRSRLEVDGAHRWYCSKLCRERHVRIEVQRRRRATPAAAQRDRELRVERKYGISYSLFEKLYSEQLGRCAVCATPLSEETKGAQVDHDHSCCPGAKSCGKCVRGLLCSSCNGGLGFFRDDVELLRSAITYLTMPEARESAPSVRNGKEV